jgi:hypothetical protein
MVLFNPLKPGGYYMYHLLYHTETQHSAHTVCICVFRMVLTTIGDCFPKHLCPVVLCSGDVMCFL